MKSRKLVKYEIDFEDIKTITTSIITIDKKLQSVLNIWDKILRQNDSKDPTKKQKKR